MARKIQNLNTEFYRYLSDNFRTLDGLNEIDYSVASYLFHLEAIRLTKKNLNNYGDEKDYIHPAVMTIAKECGIKSRTTVVNSLRKIQGKGVLRIEVTDNPYESNRYYINNEYLNQNPIDEPIEGDESFNRLMAMMLELRGEIRSVRKENRELYNEVMALHKRIQNLTNPIAEEVEPLEETVVEVVETRSLPQPEVETASISPQMSQRMSKIMERYDAFKRQELPEATISPLDAEPKPTHVEVVEQRSIPAQKPNIDYSKYDLSSSFIKFGTCYLGYLTEDELRREKDLRIKNGFDITEVINVCKMKGVSI